MNYIPLTLTNCLFDCPILKSWKANFLKHLNNCLLSLHINIWDTNLHRSSFISIANIHIANSYSWIENNIKNCNSNASIEETHLIVLVNHYWWIWDEPIRLLNLSILSKMYSRVLGCKLIFLFVPEEARYISYFKSI